MQSVVRKASYSSVRIAWLDREQLVNNVRSLARALADARPEVKKVILFGSAAKGTSTPASARRGRDRHAAQLLSKTTCPVLSATRRSEMSPVRTSSAV